MKSLTDQEEALFQDYRQGNVKGYEFIFHYFYNRIKYLCYDYLKDWDTSEDAAQHTMIKAYHKRDFENMRAIKAFLYITAKNYCLNIRRRKKLWGKYRNNNLIWDEPFMHSVFDAEVLANILFFINQLPLQMQQIMLLKLKGLSSEEIADNLNLSTQSIRNIYGKALKSIRLLIEGKALKGSYKIFNDALETVQISVCPCDLDNIITDTTAKLWDKIERKLDFARKQRQIKNEHFEKTSLLPKTASLNEKVKLHYEYVSKMKNLQKSIDASTNNSLA